MKVTAPLAQPDDTPRIVSIESATQPPAFTRDAPPSPPENPYLKQGPVNK
jgi:hypothetical protein